MFHNFANPRKGGPYHLLTHSLPPAHISIRACIYNQEVFKNKKIIIQFADYTSYPVEVNVLKTIYSWNVCVKEYKVLIMSGCNVIFFKSAIFNMSFVKKEKNRNGYFLLFVSVSDCILLL